MQIHRVLGHTPQGIHVNTHAHNHIHGLASKHSNICHETYTSHMSCDIHADKHKQAHTCSRMRLYKHTSRANMSTRMHARQAFRKKRSRSDPFARSLSEPFARRLSDPLPHKGHPTKGWVFFLFCLGHTSPLPASLDPEWIFPPSSPPGVGAWQGKSTNNSRGSYHVRSESRDPNLSRKPPESQGEKKKHGIGS